MESHESRYVRVARLAYELTQHELPSYTHSKSPHRFTWPQLAACVLLMFYVRLNYRDMEEWLRATDQVCQVLGLTRIPDHTTLYRAYKRLRARNLGQMQRELLDSLGIREEVIAVDSTGFSQNQASAYYQTRSGKTSRAWIRGAYAVGTESQFVLASRSARGPGNDVPYLNGLRRKARRYGRQEGHRRRWTLLADSGFDGYGVQEGDIIPPVRRHGKIVAPERLARRDLVDAARLDRLYGQRWKCETVHSVIKRKFGDTIRSRKASHKMREPLVKALVYNLHR